MFVSIRGVYNSYTIINNNDVMLFRVRTYVFGVLVSPRRAQTHYNAGQTSYLFRENLIYFTVEKRPYKNRLSRSALQ